MERLCGHHGVHSSRGFSLALPDWRETLGIFKKKKGACFAEDFWRALIAGSIVSRNTRAAGELMFFLCSSIELEKKSHNAHSRLLSAVTQHLSRLAEWKEGECGGKCAGMPTSIITVYI